MTIVYAVLLLGILIFVHEVGHFILAKAVGIKVTKFSLGMGPKLIGRKYGDTEYVLSAFLVGGYVKMHGEEMPGADDALEIEEKDRAFFAQPVYKRAIVVCAGSLFNIFFAVLLFSVIFLTGVPRYLSVIGEAAKLSPAAAAGLKSGDMITQIGGTKVQYWDEMTEIIHDSPGKALNFTIKGADGTSRELTITPENKASKNLFGEEVRMGLIGISPSGDANKVTYGVFESIAMGFKKTWEVIVLLLLSIVKLFQHVIPANTIGGPIMIFQMAAKQSSGGFLSFIMFMAVISINLGVFNLFPIPILDGGHMVYLAIEAVRKRPLSEQAIAIAQKIGLALLLMLMAFAMYNDVIRIITGEKLP
ncbi:RIP metalloprotease RseP [Candidatus Magnetominusculus dajiuhuensis]|uniref:RIP metalloprotease RseP n=1 Tax=Candidatus Magnetominusculus dajiuhuensis TaxID=3137712 RepID=UPI003B430BA8